MVWVHGGGFAAGSSQELKAYDGERLARRGDVVVVSMNHRLNVLGYLGLGAYGESTRARASPGMLDLVLALEWVRDNIANFGGDPGNVMIFGQSGGGVQGLDADGDARGEGPLPQGGRAQRVEPSHGQRRAVGENRGADAGAAGAERVAGRSAADDAVRTAARGRDGGAAEGPDAERAGRDSARWPTPTDRSSRPSSTASILPAPPVRPGGAGDQRARPAADRLLPERERALHQPAGPRGVHGTGRAGAAGQGVRRARQPCLRRVPEPVPEGVALRHAVTGGRRGAPRQRGHAVGADGGAQRRPRLPLDVLVADAHPRRAPAGVSLRGAAIRVRQHGPRRRDDRRERRRPGPWPRR